MPEKLDINELLKKNPHVDGAKLKEGLAVSKRLNNLGLRGKDYDLASPGENCRAQVAGSKGQRRAVHLRGEAT